MPATTPKTIRVVIVEPGKPAYEKEMVPSLEASQAIVGGLIEYCRYRSPSSGLRKFNLICNDGFLYNGSEPNRWVPEVTTQGPIYGTFFFNRTDQKGDVASLTRGDVIYLLARFDERSIR